MGVFVVAANQLVIAVCDGSTRAASIMASPVCMPIGCPSIPLTDNGTGQRSFTGCSKNLLVQPNIQDNSQRTYRILKEKVYHYLHQKKKKLYEMGHLHLLLDEIPCMSFIWGLGHYVAEFEH